MEPELLRQYRARQYRAMLMEQLHRLEYQPHRIPSDPDASLFDYNTSGGKRYAATRSTP